MPGGAVVFDVVMDQRKVVQQFDGSSGRQRLFPTATSGITAHQQQGGADSLPRLTLIGLVFLIYPAQWIAQHGRKFWGQRVFCHGLIQSLKQGVFNFREIPGKQGVKQRV